MKKILAVMVMIAGVMLCAFPSVAAAENDVASVYISSEDPAAEGREWVDASKENKAEGSMRMIDEDGSVVYDGKLKQIKSRGNSTWEDPKKPYQIKLKTAEDLCETGIADEKNKTWILLSNYKDDTLLRNQITFRIAEAMDLAFTPHCRQVDLYYDGEYRGMYLLCEKTETGTGRVDIGDLETAIEEANPDLDIDSQPTSIEKTSKGLLCQIVKNLNMPEKDGGYLLEMELSERVSEEKSWFRTERNQYIVVKSPEAVPASGMESISALYQSMENAVYNGGTDPETGRDYRDLIDIESLAKLYLIEELSQDSDAFATSFFFYKPEGEDKLYAGPVWDFDLAYGNKNMSGTAVSADGFSAAKKEFAGHLLNIPSFQEEVKKIEQESLYDIVKDTSEDILEWSASYAAHVSRNSELWPVNTSGDGQIEQHVLSAFLSERNEYLYQEIMKWDGSALDFSGEFLDVSQDAWYYEDVKYMEKNALMNGTGAGIFNPESTMSRGMMVTVLYRMAGSPEVTGSCTFNDVSDDLWCSDAIAWAQEQGISNGVGNGYFDINGEIKRQDFVTLLHRYEGSPAGKTDIDYFRDRSAVKDYALPAMKWAVEKGLIRGDDTNSLQPGSSLTRAEASAVIYRLLEN